MDAVDAASDRAVPSVDAVDAASDRAVPRGALVIPTRFRPVLLSLGLATLLLAFVAVAFWWTFSTAGGGRDLLLRVTVVLLLVFLLILLIRYFSLLWFGFLQHIERDARPEPEPPFPPVSVLVPALNEAPVLERALRSLVELDYPELEVVVVDDGSTDATLAVAERWAGGSGPLEVRVLSQANRGKAAALNLGLERSRHPFVLCMDADSRLEPDALREAVVHFHDPDVGAVAGNVKVENRDRLLTRLQALEYLEGLNMPRRAQGFIAAVNIVPGPVGLFRREALEEVGGYDLDTYAEDADLTLKLIASGWKVVYEDRSVAWTAAPTTLGDLARQRYRWTRGILQAVRKRKGRLWRPFPDFPLWISMMEMTFEALIWPAMNVYGHLFFAFLALGLGFTTPLLVWWILLTALDLTVALVTVSMEEEELGLVPLAVIYRLFYLVWLDVIKLFATVEEGSDFAMHWDKLERAPAG